jgi:Bifunctional DNA primase/polymerase, N-terminal/Primase C terminal 1 (PriCT-1)
MTGDGELLAAALTLAAEGRPVLPTHTPDAEGCCSCGRPRCPNVGKHPRTRNGLIDATTDRVIVDRWWDRWPDANVAMRTGVESGVIVLDVDGDEGADSLHALERRYGELPRTTRVKTPNGGEHFYFAHPGGRIPTTASRLGPRLDVRGDGGYALVPPSLGANGRRYELDDQQEPAAAPGWLVELMAELKSSSDGGSAGDQIPEGRRNTTLTSMAGTMRRRDIDESAILAALIDTNRRRCRPMLPDCEVEAIAASIGRYKPATASYAIDFNDKGALVLPPAPEVDDLAGHAAWLTAVLALDSRHPITVGRREGLRGPEGHIVLSRAGAEPIRFEPATRINAPQRLVETLAWQTLPTDGAVPPLKGAHCQQIAHVVRMLCGASECVTEAQEAEGIVGTFLQVATPIEGVSSYGNSRERYATAVALRREVDEITGHHVGPPRYVVDEQTRELVIAVSDLADAARRHVGSTVPRGWLDARMETLGWRRIRLDGHAVPRQAGRVGAHARINAYRGHLSAESDEGS